MAQQVHCGGCTGVITGTDEQRRVSTTVCPGVNLESQETAASLERKAAPLVERVAHEKFEEGLKRKSAEKRAVESEAEGLRREKAAAESEAGAVRAKIDQLLPRLGCSCGRPFTVEALMDDGTLLCQRCGQHVVGITQVTQAARP